MEKERYIKTVPNPKRFITPIILPQRGEPARKDEPIPVEIPKREETNK